MKHNTLALAALSTLALAAMAGTAQAATITIGSNGVAGNTNPDVPVHAWIRSDSGGNNPNDDFMFVGALNAGGNELRGLFAFDLSSPLLDGATINSVTVTVYQSGTATGSTGTSDNYDLDLTALTGAVTNGATWNSTVGFYDSTLVSITGDPTTVVENTPFTFNSNTDLVNYVQAALSSDTVQFGLKSDDLEALTERNFFAFGNNELQGTVAVPSITIDYTPVPEPGSLALLALGGISMLQRRRK